MPLSYDMAKAEAHRALSDRFGPEKASEILEVLCGGLRDQFALSAIAGMVVTSSPVVVSIKAYEVADQMLARRKISARTQNQD